MPDGKFSLKVPGGEERNGMAAGIWKCLEKSCHNCYF